MIYEIKLRYTQTLEDGKTKKAYESYLIDGDDFNEVVYTAERHASKMRLEDYELIFVKLSRAKEVIGGDGIAKNDGVKFFKVGLAETFDIDGKKKKMKYFSYIFANNYDEAYARTNMYKKTLVPCDFEITGVTETPYIFNLTTEMEDRRIDDMRFGEVRR